MRLPVPTKVSEEGPVPDIAPSTEGKKLAFITQANNLIATQLMLVTLHPLYKGDGNE